MGQWVPGHRRRSQPFCVFFFGSLRVYGNTKSSAAGEKQTLNFSILVTVELKERRDKCSLHMYHT